MEFLSNLGIDIKLLIAQLINFGLLLLLLNRFLYKPVMKKIEEDELELEKAKLQNEKLEKDRIGFEEKKKKELSEIKQKSRDILKEAEDIAKVIVDRAREETDEEKAEVIKQIKSRLAEIEDEADKK